MRVLSKLDLLHYMMRHQGLFVALCRKQVLFVKMTQGEVYSELVKVIRECLANSSDHGATTESLPSEPTHLRSPPQPRGSNLESQS
jgi:hypothetical protein